jgi:hypothetical protein
MSSAKLVTGEMGDSRRPRHRERHRARLVHAERQRDVARTGGDLETRLTKGRRTRRRGVLDLHDGQARSTQVAQHGAARRHTQQRVADDCTLDVRPLNSRIVEGFAHGREAELDVAVLALLLVAVQADADDVDGALLEERSTHYAASTGAK